jgi:hypothetical protein
MGFENFSWIILAEFFDGTDAYDFEQFLIDQNLNDKLILNQYVNKVHYSRWKRVGPMSSESARKSAMARTGRKASLEHRMKISESHKGKSFSEETKAKMSASAKNRKPISDESRAKMSASRKGMNKAPKSLEHKEKLSKAQSGKKLSIETREKLSQIGKGRKVSDQTRAKISSIKTGKICINNQIKNIMIAKSELNDYLALGWAAGRKKS